MGKHRKITASQTAKGRIAFVTLAAGAVSGAGVGGAAAASLDSESTSPIALVNDAEADESTEASTDASPQVLAIAEYKPVNNLTNQLDKAIAAAEERMEADLAARGPAVVKPAEGAFTSGFGPRWGAFHAGIDIANAVGTPILAVMDGVVIDSGIASGYGNWIRILHEDGSISVYGHMETLDVVVGQVVRAGDKIAGMGNRGFSTGPHLHFEIHPGGNGAVDPVPWFAERGIAI